MQRACLILQKCLRAAVGAVWPRTCPVCGSGLIDSETFLCINCLSKLPRTGLHLDDFNMLHQRLGPATPINKAMAWWWYVRGDATTSVILDAKYHDRPRLLLKAAEIYAGELRHDGCPIESFADIIVPTPMHTLKRMRRGYNQSEWIAQGLSRQCGLPVVRCLKATKTHRTQTRLNALERARNLSGTITLARPDQVGGRRILLVDDIITTGSTMQVCLHALSHGSPAALSILALGAARKC